MCLTVSGPVPIFCYTDNKVVWSLDLLFNSLYILVDSSTLICYMGPFFILGMSCLFHY